MSKKMTRKRDAAATRKEILSAARRQFMEKGFDAAGVREIAADAGVNAALVNRYFGSKDGLFEEAIIPGLNIDDLLEGDRATFGARVAELMATKPKDHKDFDPTLAFVRSAGSATVGPMMSEAIERAMVEKFARWLGGADAKQRAGLIVAHLFGFDMLRRVIGLKALAPRHAKKIVHRFADTLQSYVDDR